MLFSLLAATFLSSSAPGANTHLSIPLPPSTTFAPTPMVRQSRNFTCGAAALQSVLGYWGDDFREGVLQYLLGSHHTSGTSLRQMIAFAPRLNDAAERFRIEHAFSDDESAPDLAAPGEPVDLSPYRVEAYGSAERYGRGHGGPGCEGAATEDPSPLLKPATGWPGIRAAIDAKTPVLVTLQAYATEARAYGRRWDSGHYVVVVGYDAQYVFFMDPSNIGNYVALPREEFLLRWYDYDGGLSPNGERCPGGWNLRQLAIVIRREGGPRFQPPNVLSMP